MVTIAAQGLGVHLGGRMVLDGVTAAFAGGSLVGILGPNGAGKSTLIRALLGLVPAAAGSVVLDGAPIATFAPRQVARRIAYLAQGHTLHWPLTVERIVALGRLPRLAPFSRLDAADEVAVARAMARAGVGHLTGRTATELSGGERARVLLASALAVEAPALLVDEPLASLDPEHQLEIMALLHALAAAGTLVLAALHDLSLAARFCDRLLLLRAGRLVADGTPTAVLDADGLAQTFGIRAWIGEIEGAAAIVPLDRIARSPDEPQA